MRNFFGYIRVSTPRQGEHGVSLHEQRDAILRYAERHGVAICRWFEERETAAKRGRPVFAELLRLLRRRQADGVVIHKIDRSARNMKDWAEIGELSDSGVEVRFVNESVDMHSRSGRLSADILAVVASDYVRNLKEEIRKGFYGRVKQGVYPLPAPLGYLDKGPGKAKEIDPVKGPLVRKAFELYGTGRFNLEGLVEKMYGLGLRNRRGRKVSLSGLSSLLNNPFHIGLIRLQKTGETFPGAHQPLVPKSLFDRVHSILEGRTPTRILVHDFLFRRLLACRRCGYALIGERQKGHAYYRCHTKGCATKCIRQEIVEDSVLQQLSPLQFNRTEKDYFVQRVHHLRENWGEERETQVNALSLRLGQVQDRLGRLTDAYLDGAIEKGLFEERKATLLLERRDLEEKLAELKSGGRSVPDRLAEFLELAGSAYLLYKTGLPEEKRDLLKIVTSNRVVDGRNVDLMLSQPFALVADRTKNSYSGPERTRTVTKTPELVLDGKIGSLPRLTLAEYLSLHGADRGGHPRVLEVVGARVLRISESRRGASSSVASLGALHHPREIAKQPTSRVA